MLAGGSEIALPWRTGVWQARCGDEHLREAYRCPDGAGLVDRPHHRRGCGTSCRLVPRVRCDTAQRGRTRDRSSGVDVASLVVQPTAREGLTPGLDQTRTVGLVTLPGALVGVLLGGTPLEAGAAQVLVLIGLMAAQAITAALLLRQMAIGRVVRRDLALVHPR